MHNDYWLELDWLPRKTPSINTHTHTHSKCQRMRTVIWIWVWCCVLASRLAPLCCWRSTCVAVPCRVIRNRNSQSARTCIAPTSRQTNNRIDSAGTARGSHSYGCFNTRISPLRTCVARGNTIGQRAAADARAWWGDPVQY